ncbi:hypothetical protein [Deinococcus sedimenti]|uniref:Nuclease n=1 Tax=Deinococcus sedimenti TaxID=1867090 RepID=A0ABQ2SDI6_9DEIO|nr:hypothetical protein [Deinococcus sedimenti]GGS11209.1 hypothetical protein GCM10008960_41510 [Deinococcus sedimenti]
MKPPALAALTVLLSAPALAAAPTLREAVRLAFPPILEVRPIGDGSYVFPGGDLRPTGPDAVLFTGLTIEPAGSRSPPSLYTRVARFLNPWCGVRDQAQAVKNLAAWATRAQQGNVALRVGTCEILASAQGYEAAFLVRRAAGPAVWPAKVVR